MKKARILCISLLGLTLLGACSTTKSEKDKKESSESSSLVDSSSVEKKEPTIQERFDALPQEVKVVLFANTVDSRVKEYPNLEELSLYYAMDKEDIYLQLTSNAGTGHPIYKLTLDNKGITPEQGVSYMGVTGYELVDVNKQAISKENLLKEYNDNKNLYDNSAKKVEISNDLKNLFDEQMATITPADETSTVNNSTESKQVSQPSNDEILSYFTSYVLTDVGVTDDFTKQQTHYGVDESGQPMIRYGGGQGAYATIEGNKIIYKGYSFGGVSSDGTVAKNELYTAYYNFETGEHGNL